MLNGDRSLIHGWRHFSLMLQNVNSTQPTVGQVDKDTSLTLKLNFHKYTSLVTAVLSSCLSEREKKVLQRDPISVCVSFLDHANPKSLRSIGFAKVE